MLGRQLALVTGLSQRKAGAWFRAGEAAGSGYWIKSSIRPGPSSVLGGGWLCEHPADKTECIVGGHLAFVICLSIRGVCVALCVLCWLSVYFSVIMGQTTSTPFLL